MKGKVLEQIVQQILLRQGYGRIDSSDPKFKPDTGKFEGRGADHELDAFGQYKHSIPFVNPIRLLGEAKCYKANYSVGVDIIREAITVRKDIDENYQGQPGDEEVDRRVECFAVFSTSGFSSSAIELARAHGIYLVSLGHLRPIVNKVVDEHDPQTHEEAERAATGYFEENLGNTLHFASLIDGYPAALQGRLPADRLATTDTLRAYVTPGETQLSNVTQFDLQGMDSSSQWELRTEVPTWRLANVIDRNDPESLTLTVPTVLDELARQIRIQVDTATVEDLL
jgi:hypothetical protein